MNTHELGVSMNSSVLALAGAAGLLAVLGVGATWLGPWPGVGMPILIAGAVVGLLAYAGSIAHARQVGLESGAADLFLARNASRCEGAVLGGRAAGWGASRRWVARHVFGHRLMIGDRVRVKALDAIRATLDAQGCLDGLPFMDEMAAHCGRQFRVYRVLDKIYDYGRSRRMRRLDDCVLLVGLRCDGSAHGGCEAACYLIWKTHWLERQLRSAPMQAPETCAALPQAPALAEPYSCQYTQLAAASRPMRQLDARGLLGPLVVGNVTAAAFRIALLTRIFNAVQAWRGGVGYPARPASLYDKTIIGSPLHAGDWVRVKPPDEIAHTLDANSKNRGLWFDRDMLKHAGAVYRVLGRIRKIIDVNSGAMIEMKSACVVLDGVHCSGEFQGFGEQHDFLYWREAWLTRATPPHATPD